MRCFPEVYMLDCHSGIYTFQQEKKVVSFLLKTSDLRYKSKTKYIELEKGGRSNITCLSSLGTQDATKCTVGSTRACK